MHSPTSERTIVSLVQAAEQRDPKAEEELCRRFASAVRTFARRRLRSSDAVEEFAQDVMLHFVEALRRGAIDDPARVGGFVLGICRNLARDRARARERRAQLWEQYGAALEVLEADAPDRSRREMAHLEDCLSQLAERTRHVIRYAYVEGESNVTIASRLGMTEGNVRVVRHRALATLRDCMSSPKLSWEGA